MDGGIEDRDFDEVESGSLRACRCSPDLSADRTFRGIRLNAPRRVRFGDGELGDRGEGAFARVIVCGSSCFDAGYLGHGQRFVPHVVIVAVDAANHRAFAGKIASASGWPEDAPLSPAALAGRVIGESFNPNLAALLGLPETEADYLVHARLGTYVSNVVRIEVRRYD